MSENEHVSAGDVVLGGVGYYPMRIWYKDTKVKKLHSQKRLRSGAWIEVVATDEETLTTAATKLKLDPMILRDVLDEDEVPRMESEEEGLYLFVRVPQGEDGVVATQSVLLVVTQKYVVVVSREPVAWVRKLLERKDVYTTQKTKSVVAFFLTLTSQYQREVIRYSRQIRKYAKNIGQIRSRDVRALLQVEMVLDDYLGALEPTGIVLEQLLSGKYLRLFELDREMIEDLFIATSQLVEMSRARVKQSRNIRQVHETILSNKLNQTMKLLTSVTVILTVPTMVFSFYGMNVPLPMAEDPAGFGWILAGTVVLSALLGVLFWKRDML